MRVLSISTCSPLGTGIDPKTCMGGSRRRQIEVAENLPHWCEALRGESCNLSHGKAKATEGCYTANPSPAAMPSNTFPCNICGRRCTARIGLTAHSHEESQELVRDRSWCFIRRSIIVITCWMVAVNYNYDYFFEKSIKLQLQLRLQLSWRRCNALPAVGILIFT